jgi:hypothetical protein
MKSESNNTITIALSGTLTDCPTSLESLLHGPNARSRCGNHSQNGLIDCPSHPMSVATTTIIMLISP